MKRLINVYNGHCTFCYTSFAGVKKRSTENDVQTEGYKLKESLQPTDVNEKQNPQIFAATLHYYGLNR